MARRKLVSATKASCVRKRLPVWRQVPISSQAVSKLSAANQPKQAIAHHAQRGAVGLGTIKISELPTGEMRDLVLRGLGLQAADSMYWTERGAGQRCACYEGAASLSISVTA